VENVGGNPAKSPIISTGGEEKGVKLWKKCLLLWTFEYTKVDLTEGLFLRSSEEAGELGSTVGLPCPDHSGPGCLGGHLLSPNSRSISSCGMPSPRSNEARALQCGGSIRRDVLIVDWH